MIFNSGTGVHLKFMDGPEPELKQLKANLEFILKCERLAKKGNMFEKFGLNREWHHIYSTADEIYPMLNDCEGFDQALLSSLNYSIIYLMNVESEKIASFKDELKEFFESFDEILFQFGQSIIAKTKSKLMLYL